MTIPTKIKGFTLIELIMVMVITGVLAIAAIPRFTDRQSFVARGFYDQTGAMLRYAQKTAIAQRRFVCAAFTSSSITLTINATAACLPGTALALASPDGKPTYVISVPSGITFPTTPTNFSFDALGRPSPNAQQTIGITGAGVTRTISVERETGYVH